MTIAEYIADRLFSAGVRYFFGIPGGASIPYLEAFRKRGIEFILVSHESAAAVMADVTSRLTGVPGVCHATFGPGATNITTGTGGALLDRSSVIVLTSEIGDRMINRTVQMNIDHQRLFAPITKATFRLSPENAIEVVNRAVGISISEVPGPVHIGLPEGIADMETGDGEAQEAPVQAPPVVNRVTEITDILASSRRPVAAVGLTAARLGLKREIRSFIDRSGIPVVVTPMAKGMIMEDHPCYAGVLFHALSDYLDDLTTGADLIIGIGYDPVEYNYESWIPDVPLVHFGTVECDLPERDNAYGFTGMPEEWFDILGNIDPGRLEDRRQHVSSIKNDIRSVIRGFRNRFGPAAALDVLNNALPEGSLVTFDVGSHLHLAGQAWDVMDRHELLMTNGWSSMGFAIPAAVGARFARPGGVIAAITGDGGFVMSPGEILTAIRYNLHIIIIVLSDGELNLIKLKQSWKDINPYGVSLYHGDLFGSDVFFGAKVIRATDNTGLQNAITCAAGLNEPVIINCIIDPEDYRWLVTKR